MVLQDTADNNDWEGHVVNQHIENSLFVHFNVRSPPLRLCLHGWRPNHCLMSGSNPWLLYSYNQFQLSCIFLRFILHYDVYKQIHFCISLQAVKPFLEICHISLQSFDWTICLHAKFLGPIYTEMVFLKSIIFRNNVGKKHVYTKPSLKNIPINTETLKTTEIDVVPMPGFGWHRKFTPQMRKKKKKTEHSGTNHGDGKDSSWKDGAYQRQTLNFCFDIL